MKILLKVSRVSILATSADSLLLIRGHDLLLWVLQLFFSAAVTRRLITNILGRRAPIFQIPRDVQMFGRSGPWHGERVGVTLCDRRVLGGLNAAAVPATCSDKSFPNLLSLSSQSLSPASCAAVSLLSAVVWISDQTMKTFRANGSYCLSWDPTKRDRPDQD